MQGGLWPVEEEGPPLVYEETVDHGELAPTAAALELGLFGSKPMVGERKVLLIHLGEVSDWKLDIQVRGASMVLHLPESFDA